jgi:hypothetical protein
MRDAVRLAHAVEHATGNGLQHQITDMVAKSVVDRLEAAGPRFVDLAECGRPSALGLDLPWDARQSAICKPYAAQAAWILARTAGIACTVARSGVQWRCHQ